MVSLPQEGGFSSINPALARGPQVAAPVPKRRGGGGGSRTATVNVSGDTVTINGQGFSVAPELQVSFIQRQTGGRGGSAQQAIAAVKANLAAQQRAAELAREQAKRLQEQKAQQEQQKRISEVIAKGNEPNIITQNFLNQLEAQDASTKQSRRQQFEPSRGIAELQELQGGIKSQSRPFEALPKKPVTATVTESILESPGVGRVIKGAGNVITSADKDIRNFAEGVEGKVLKPGQTFESVLQSNIDDVAQAAKRSDNEAIKVIASIPRATLGGGKQLVTSIKQKPVQTFGTLTAAGLTVGAGLKLLSTVPKVGKGLAFTAGTALGIGYTTSIAPEVLSIRTPEQAGSFVTKQILDLGAFSVGAKAGSRTVGKLFDPYTKVRPLSEVNKVTRIQGELFTRTTSKGPIELLNIRATGQVRPSYTIETTTRAREFFGRPGIETPKIIPEKTFNIITPEPANIKKPFNVVRKISGRRSLQFFEIGKSYSKLISQQKNIYNIKSFSAVNPTITLRNIPGGTKVTRTPGKLEFGLSVSSLRLVGNKITFASLSRKVSPLPELKSRARLLEGLKLRRTEPRISVGEITLNQGPKITRIGDITTQEVLPKKKKTVTTQDTIKESVRVISGIDSIVPKQKPIETPSTIKSQTIRTIAPSLQTRSVITSLPQTTRQKATRQKQNTLRREKQIQESLNRISQLRLQQGRTKQASSQRTNQIEKQLQKSTTAQRQLFKRPTLQKNTVQRLLTIPGLRGVGPRLRRPITEVPREPAKIPDLEFDLQIPGTKRNKKKRFQDVLFYTPGFTERTLGIKRKLTRDDITKIARRGVGRRPVPIVR